jgi:hypothetical protein
MVIEYNRLEKIEEDLPFLVGLGFMGSCGHYLPISQDYKNQCHGREKQKKKE